MLRRELREYTFKLLFHGNFYEGEEPVLHYKQESEYRLIS